MKPSAPVPGQDDTLKQLEAVARLLNQGEIDVQEAERRIAPLAQSMQRQTDASIARIGADAQSSRRRTALWVLAIIASIIAVVVFVVPNPL